MFVAADKAWYIQLFGYNYKIITLVSACLLQPRKEFIGAAYRWQMGLIYTRLQTLVTGFGLYESMESVCRCVWHGEAARRMMNFETREVVVEESSAAWEANVEEDRRQLRRTDRANWFFLVKESYVVVFLNSSHDKSKVELLLLIQRLQHNFVWAPCS